MSNETKSTALDLNNQIVRMRALIGQAKFRLVRRCIQKIKKFRKRKESAPPSFPKKRIERLERKTERLLEERLKYDDASKFALVNTKSLKEFNVQQETPAADRALYKLVTLPIVVDCVNEYRSKHPNWHQEIPFHLQRLGLQYKLKRAKKIEMAKIRKANRGSATNYEDENVPKNIDRQGRFGTALVSKLRLQEADSGSAILEETAIDNSESSSRKQEPFSPTDDVSDNGDSDKSEVDDFFIM
ncbi:serum response factor binding protein 1 [Trichuris trichiura]|uniref:Serum response factor binding protein 1 n=1 Tax=Trichuris trichiura TaxID=36087 RepID=A0A077ZDK9_TRITR|nr:serum response factor binding protein 1 [Trichuris trichiura]